MTARASDKLSDLIGVGLEYYLDAYGNVRLEFYNGNIIKGKGVGNMEPTLS